MSLIVGSGGRPMSAIKTLWASVQGDPVFMRRVNGWLTIFWILMIPTPPSRSQIEELS